MRKIKTLKALIVDDNDGQRRALGTVVLTLGLDVEFALNGAEAVEAVARQMFDLILMDISMPVMDGLEATKLIRAQEQKAARRPTPLFVVTSHDDEAHREAAHRAGADGHIPKPAPILKLVEAVGRSVETSAVHAPKRRMRKAG